MACGYRVVGETHSDIVLKAHRSLRTWGSAVLNPYKSERLLFVEGWELEERFLTPRTAYGMAVFSVFCDVCATRGGCWRGRIQPVTIKCLHRLQGIVCALGAAKVPE